MVSDTICRSSTPPPPKSARTAKVNHKTPCPPPSMVF
jgi:hypothetical protein